MGTNATVYYTIWKFQRYARTAKVHGNFIHSATRMPFQSIVKHAAHPKKGESYISSPSKLGVCMHCRLTAKMMLASRNLWLEIVCELECGIAPNATGELR